MYGSLRIFTELGPDKNLNNLHDVHTSTLDDSSEKQFMQSQKLPDTKVNIFLHYVNIYTSESSSRT